jgi:hypothetical protein
MGFEIIAITFIAGKRNQLTGSRFDQAQEKPKLGMQSIRM